MENFEDNLFLKANLEKEIPILRTQIQNLYEQLDRKFHLQGAMGADYLRHGHGLSGLLHPGQSQ